MRTPTYIGPLAGLALALIFSSCDSLTPSSEHKEAPAQLEVLDDERDLGVAVVFDAPFSILEAKQLLADQDSIGLRALGYYAGGLSGTATFDPDSTGSDAALDEFKEWILERVDKHLISDRRHYGDGLAMASKKDFASSDSLRKIATSLLLSQQEREVMLRTINGGRPIVHTLVMTGNRAAIEAIRDAAPAPVQEYVDLSTLSEVRSNTWRPPIPRAVMEAENRRVEQQRARFNELAPSPSKSGSPLAPQSVEHLYNDVQELLSDVYSADSNDDLRPPNHEDLFNDPVTSGTQPVTWYPSSGSFDFDGTHVVSVRFSWHSAFGFKSTRPALEFDFNEFATSKLATVYDPVYGNILQTVESYTWDGCWTYTDLPYSYNDCPTTGVSDPPGGRGYAFGTYDARATVDGMEYLEEIYLSYSEDWGTYYNQQKPIRWNFIVTEIDGQYYDGFGTLQDCNNPWCLLEKQDVEFLLSRDVVLPLVLGEDRFVRWQ